MSKLEDLERRVEALENVVVAQGKAQDMVNKTIEVINATIKDTQESLVTVGNTLTRVFSILSKLTMGKQ